MIEDDIDKIWESVGFSKYRDAEVDFQRVMSNSIGLEDFAAGQYMGAHLIMARKSYLLISKNLVEASLSNNKYVRDMAQIILKDKDNQ